jgi:hypothetical protein
MIQEVRAVSLKQERELLEIERSTQYQTMMRPVAWWKTLGTVLVGASAVVLVLVVVAIQPYLPWWRAQAWYLMVAIACFALVPSVSLLLLGAMCRSLSQTRKESIEASFIQLQVDKAVERAFFLWLGASESEYLATRGSLSLGDAVRREVDREAKLVQEVERLISEILELMGDRGAMIRIKKSREALQAANQLILFLADQREHAQVRDKDFVEVERVREQLQEALSERQPDNVINLMSVSATPAE